MRHAIAALFLLLASVAHADILVPQPALVADQVGLLSEGDRSRVAEALRALRAATHPASMAIVIIGKVPDGDMETYALTVARTWGLGHAGVNDGLLLVHAVEDDRYRFEVGPCLQGVLNDAAIGDIGRQVLVPELQAKHPRMAYLAAIEAISLRLGNPPDGTAPIEPPPPPEAPLPGPRDIQRMVIMVIAALVLGIALRRHFVLGVAGAAAATGTTVAALGFPLGAELTRLMLMGGGLAFAVALVSRNFGQLMLALAAPTSAGSRDDTSRRDSPSSPSDAGSPSESGGGGSFDGGGASGDY